MSKSANKNQNEEVKREEPEEVTSEPIDDAKKAFFVLIKSFQHVMKTLQGGTASQTVDYRRKLVDKLDSEMELAIAMSPWSNFDDVKIDVAKCRSCGKLTWMEQDKPQYCAICIASTRQTA